MFRFLENYFRKKEEEKFLLELGKAYVEGEQKRMITAAINSLEKKFKAPEENNNYCVKASVLIVQQLMKSCRISPKNIVDDDLIIAGIFICILSDHISRIVVGEFEIISMRAMLQLFSNYKPIESSPDYIGEAIRMYNDLAENKSKVIEAIGQNLIAWLQTHDRKYYKAMVEIYKLCKKNMKTV